VSSFQIEHAAALVLSALVLGAVAAYVGVALPRLSSRVATAVTAAWAVALLLAAALGTAFIAVALALCAMALVAGHLGWSAGVRTRKIRTGRAHAPAQPAAPVPTEPPDSDSMPMQAGDSAGSVGLDRATLGRYRIERQLGRGAMGTVYLGLDPKIGRQVAIKTMALSQEFEGDELAEARSRFFREAETAGRLQHPDIVTIFDAGEDQELAYISMEYLKGQDLQAFTQPGRLLSPHAVLHIVARVADALAYAHSQGVVHRDVKPANVMVDLKADIVKVTDFGIARITDSSRTRTGLVLGTPSFMSPEQMAGRRLDGRSDLYSLGVMLFQLLTGRLPHQADSMARVMYLIANESAPDIRSLRPELPEALANIVAIALEKRPEVRYGDGKQMAADLREVEAWYVQMGGEASGEVSGADAGPSTAQQQGAGTQAPPSGAFEDTVKFLRPDPGHNSDR
jgi:tRNA A-37 threonylcarbamoyl transferase component Bud32